MNVQNKCKRLVNIEAERRRVTIAPNMSYVRSIISLHKCSIIQCTNIYLLPISFFFLIFEEHRWFQRQRDFDIFQNDIIGMYTIIEGQISFENWFKFWKHQNRCHAV